MPGALPIGSAHFPFAPVFPKDQMTKVLPSPAVEANSLGRSLPAPPIHSFSVFPFNGCSPLTL